jgi:hypothetical protein
MFPALPTLQNQPELITLVLLINLMETTSMNSVQNLPKLEAVEQFIRNVAEIDRNIGLLNQGGIARVTVDQSDDVT